MILYIANIVISFFMKEKDIRKNASLLETEKNAVLNYFNANMFLLLFLSLFIVLLPYTYINKIDNKTYYISYIILTILFFIIAVFFNKKYEKLIYKDKKILAEQESSFDNTLSESEKRKNFKFCMTEKYKDREFLNEIEKTKIKKSNNFKYSIRRSDLTIQDINLDRQIVKFDFSIFEKELAKKTLNSENFVLYRKLMEYINAKAKYHHLKNVKIENGKNKYNMETLQTNIYKTVKELYDKNVTLKISQLLSYADDIKKMNLNTKVKNNLLKKQQNFQLRILSLQYLLR